LATGKCEKTVTVKDFGPSFDSVDYSQRKQEIIVTSLGCIVIHLFNAETGEYKGKFSNVDHEYLKSIAICYNQAGTQFLDLTYKLVGKTTYTDNGTGRYVNGWKQLDEELGERWHPGGEDYYYRGTHHCTTAAAHSPDGQYIAVAHSEKNPSTANPLQAFIKIFENKTDKCIQTLFGRTGTIISIAFSPDNHYIATASEDKTVKIWDIETGTCIQTLSGHTGAVQYVIYSPDGAHLSTFSQDGIRIWKDANITVREIRPMLLAYISPKSPAQAFASQPPLMRYFAQFLTPSSVKPALPFPTQIPAVENPQPLVDKVMAALSETNKETLLNLAAEVKDYPDLAATVTELIQRVL
jgi:WD40 repeat protein